MKEFANKLIGRLEELMKKDCVVRENDHYVVKNTKKLIEISYKNAIKIVNELAEEYINTSTDTSSGWIPCSERLPKYAGDYLVTQHNPKAVDEYCNECRISTIFFDNSWWDDIDDAFGWDIIAWMPLPAPFVQVETNAEWKQHILSRFEGDRR